MVITRSHLVLKLHGWKLSFTVASGKLSISRPNRSLTAKGTTTLLTARSHVQVIPQASSGFLVGGSGRRREPVALVDTAPSTPETCVSR